MRNVIITGGAGFIGSHVVNYRRSLDGNLASSLKRVLRKPLSGILIIKSGWIMSHLVTIRIITRISIRIDKYHLAIDK